MQKCGANVLPVPMTCSAKSLGDSEGEGGVIIGLGHFYYEWVLNAAGVSTRRFPEDAFLSHFSSFLYSTTDLSVSVVYGVTDHRVQAQAFKSWSHSKPFRLSPTSKQLHSRIVKTQRADSGIQSRVHCAEQKNNCRTRPLDFEEYPTRNSSLHTLEFFMVAS